MPKTTISHNDLRNIDLVPDSKILQTSIEYLIVKVCEKYCDINNIKSISEFNKVNNISIIKAIVYPFFISTSNGHFEALYNLFGKFTYSDVLGFMSERAYTEISKIDKFKINTGIVINEENKTWEDILNDILKKAISENGVEAKYDEIEIVKDNGGNNYLYKAIDSGILTLLKLTSNEFFNYSEADLRISSKRYIAYLKDEQPSYQNIDRIRKNIYFSTEYESTEF